MQIKTMLNNCYKCKSFVYSDVRFSTKYGGKCLDVYIVPRANSKPICSECHQTGSVYDTAPEPREFEFIPFWGTRVFFLYRMRRVNCRACGVKVEHVPWAQGKSTSTKPYMQFLAHFAKKLSWQDVAREFNSSWDKVKEAVKYVVDYGLKHRDVSNVESIGIDEIAHAKGHKYLTLVYQIDSGAKRLLWVGKNRTVRTLLRFFRQFGPEFSNKLKHVCSDLWQPYLKVIKRKASNAINILDKFHISQKFNKAIDEVRATEHKQLIADGFEPVLKKSRWCLLKRKNNLTNSQEANLADLLKYNLKTVKSYLLKEDFHRFWDYTHKSWAGKFLDAWCKKTMLSKIDPMKKVAKMLRKHKELILNYFVAQKQFSSGVVEGLNNKIKVTMRKSYGFRTTETLEIALYHALGGLPEPPLTHRFF